MRPSAFALELNEVRNLDSWKRLRVLNLTRTTASHYNAQTGVSRRLPPRHDIEPRPGRKPSLARSTASVPVIHAGASCSDAISTQAQHTSIVDRGSLIGALSEAAWLISVRVYGYSIGTEAAGLLGSSVLPLPVLIEIEKLSPCSA
jgi:hypothetical protein